MKRYIADIYLVSTFGDHGIQCTFRKDRNGNKC